MSVTEARRQWSTLLSAVEAGESVTITRYGRAVALLSPASGGPRLPDGAALCAANPPLPMSAGQLLREMRDDYRY